MIATILSLLGGFAVPKIIFALLGGGGIAAALVKWGLRGAWGRIEANRSWLILVAVAAAGAALYAWGSTIERDRNRLRGWGSMVCISVGSELQPAKGKRGVACATAIAEFVAFKTKTAEVSADAMRKHLDEETRKSAGDASSARRDADRARSVLAQMEKANAAIGPNDRVDGAWLRAFNDAAGLRR